jgi:tetratricopeptide (TPR) repeat protein
MKMINRIAIVSLILLCLFVTPVTVSASESRTLYDDGNYTGALHLLNQALRSNPTSVDLLTDMGATLNEMGNYTGVISFFKKVLSIDPHHIGALAGIVSTLDSIGKHSGAHIFQRGDRSTSKRCCLTGCESYCIHAFGRLS